MYENIIYLKNGTVIRQESDISLVKQTMNVKDWSKGNIVLLNKNQMLIPNRNILSIETNIITEDKE